MCDLSETSLFGACGLGGDCEENLCVCRRSWAKSDEFSFSSSPHSRNGTRDLICDANTPLLFILYSSAFILLVGGAISYACAAKKWSQRKRLLPFHVMMTVSATFCLGKLIFSGNSVSTNLPLAILFALMTFFAVVSTVVLLTKYIDFRYKVGLLYNPDFSKFIRLLTCAGYICIAVEMIAVGCFISVPIFAEDSHERALRFTRLGFLLFSISTLFGPITALIILNRLISIMKEKYSTDKARSVIKGMRKTRNLLLVSGTQTFLFIFPASFSETWLRLEKYFVPATLMIYAFISCALLLATLKMKKKNKAKIKNVIIATN